MSFLNVSTPFIALPLLLLLVCAEAKKSYQKIWWTYREKKNWYENGCELWAREKFMKRFMTRFSNYFQSPSDRKYSFVEYKSSSTIMLESFFFFFRLTAWTSSSWMKLFLLKWSKFSILQCAFNRKRDIWGQKTHFLDHYQRFWKPRWEWFVSVQFSS